MLHSRCKISRAMVSPANRCPGAGASAGEGGGWTRDLAERLEPRLARRDLQEPANDTFSSRRLLIQDDEYDSARRYLRCNFLEPRGNQGLSSAGLPRLRFR